jgi:flagellar hook-basal body complex protein FliE
MIPALSAVSSLVGMIATSEVFEAATRPSNPAPAQRAGFDSVMAEVGKAADNLKAAEAASISGVEGKVAVQEVVEAVMSAEQSLKTALAIRDKLVTAYQALSQMAI